MRYADPALCPDCRGPITTGIDSCPACGLLLRHRIGVELFRTLSQADAQVAELRRLSTIPATAPVPMPGAAGPAPLPTYPSPTPMPTSMPAPAPRRTGVASRSVPKILLGLGALCLLSAAVIFLAVSWSALGVGGRTAVLAGLTVLAAGSALGLHRIGLRIAGESLSVVALGLLALDVVGSGSTDWFGNPDADSIGLATGLILAVAAGAMGLLRIAGQPRLVAPQIITGIATLVSYSAALSVTGHPLLAGHIFVAVGLGIVVLARRSDLPGLMWSLAAVTGLIWLTTALAGLGRSLDDPSLHQLWVDGSGWSLLASAVTLIAPGVITRHRTLTLAGASCAAMITTAVVVLPTVDSTATVFGIVSLAVTLLWAFALWLMPQPWRIVAIAPASTGALLLLGQVLTGFGFALARWVDIATYLDAPFDIALDRPDQAVQAAIIVPAALTALLVVMLLLPRGKVIIGVWLRLGAVFGAFAATITLASYDVPLVSVVVALLGVSVLAAVLGQLIGRDNRIEGDLYWTGALLVAAAATITAVCNDVATLGSAAVGSALAAVAVTQQSRSRQVLGGLALAPLVATAVVAAVSVCGADAAWAAVPVLVATWLTALVRPRVEIEVAAAAVSLAVLPASLAAAEQPLSLLSFWLAVAGCLACASALLHTSRHALAPIGAGLLLLATWVRLVDLDVSAPEAYTLPLASAMIGFGLFHLQRDPDAGTAPALLPGLLLAVVPSLLWVLDDPLSLRALLLGTGCLVLTIAGAVLRWSAPLVVGAVTGSIVVLREIGPYAGDVPQWVWIGLAGALLTIVGITWERQLLELRKAVGAVTRLR